MPECALRRLMQYGFMPVLMPPSARLSEPLSSHPDMLICRIGDELVSTSDYLEASEAEMSVIYDNTHMRMHFTSDIHGTSYPDDVILNALVMGKSIYAREASLSIYLKELADSRGYTVINSNQGYPACTVMKLSDEAAITADRGMYALLSENGIRTYLIEQGGIELPPYEYGFIGGASGVYSGCAYFIGNAEKHPSYDIIKEALDKEGLRPVMLGDFPLSDLGGILFLEGDVNDDRNDGYEQ